MSDMKLTTEQAAALSSLFVVSRLTETWDRLESELRMSEEEVIDAMLAIQQVRLMVDRKPDAQPRPRCADGRYAV